MRLVDVRLLDVRLVDVRLLDVKLPVAPFLGMPLVLLLGCEPDAPPTFDQREMLGSIANNLLVPTLADGETAMEALSVATDAFCATPTDETLTAAQAAWRAARASWKTSEAFGFGPAETLRTAANLDFWPVRPDSVEEVLSGSDTLDASVVAAMGSTTRGLPVLEYLLFANEAQTTVTLYTDAGSGERRCLYTRLLADDAVTTMAALHAEWRDNTAAELASAGGGSTLWPTEQLAVSDIINHMLGLAERMKVTQVGIPAGTKNGGVPQPDLVESPYSDNALDDLQHNLDGLSVLYAGNDDGMGLSAYVQTRKAEVDTTMKEDFSAASTAIAAVPPPLETAVFDDPAAVETVYERLDGVLQTLQLDVVVVYGVTVSFTDSDGD